MRRFLVFIFKRFVQINHGVSMSIFQRGYESVICCHIGRRQYHQAANTTERQSTASVRDMIFWSHTNDRLKYGLEKSCNQADLESMAIFS